MKKDNCESIFAGKCPCSLPVVGTGGCTGICVYGKTGTGFLRVKNSPNSQIGHNLQTKSKQTCSIICYALTRETGKEALDCPERNELAEMEGGLSEENRL